MKKLTEEQIENLLKEQAHVVPTTDGEWEARCIFKLTITSKNKDAYTALDDLRTQLEELTF